jgi:segregation and condensation protein A
MAEYRVHFEVFEGPLDLLLHLVKKQEVDIYQVNLTRIATEFVTYIEEMRELDLDVAGEFVVMAATLLYIKSRELLPTDKQAVVEGDDPDDEDPRWELIRRLVEYKKFKDAAGQLQEREANMDLVYPHQPSRFEPPPEPEVNRLTVSIFDLVQAVAVILKRHAERTDIREIQADPHTVSDRIDFIRKLLAERPAFRFGELFDAAKSRTEVVVTFLALLELIRLKVVVAAQPGEFGEIFIEAAPPNLEPAQLEMPGLTEAASPATPHPEPSIHPRPQADPEHPPADFVPPPDIRPPGEPPEPNPLGSARELPTPA